MIEKVVIYGYTDPTDEAYRKLCNGEISEQEYFGLVKEREDRIRETGSPYIKKRIEWNIETDEEPERIDYNSGHPYR